MPTQITKYCCNECNSEYLDYNQAMQCETLYCEPPLAEVGGTITYENEDTLFGQRYSYCTQTGIVLHRYKTYSKENGQPKHEWVYIVKPHNREVEVEVFLAKDDFGVKQLVSLASRKFSAGYADSLKATFTPFIVCGA